MSRPDLAIHASASALHEDAAGRFVAAATVAVAEHGRFDVILTGGSTLPAVYERLSAEPFRSRVAWGGVRVWWTDERCVPPDDPRSNYGVAREALLDRVPIPCEQIHRMRGEDPNPERAAVLHEATLRREQSLSPGELPRFDFAFLGLGTDAHVASLFPRAATLAMNDRLAAAVRRVEVAIPDPSIDRLTLTFPALNASRAAVFLVAGEAKAEAVRAVLEEPRDAALRPAQGISPSGGAPAWILDRAAASLLEAAR